MILGPTSFLGRCPLFLECQCTVTGCDSEFGLQLLYQFGGTCNCLDRPVPEVRCVCCRDVQQPRINNSNSTHTFLSFQ